jgi:hypothetical protein
VLEAVLDTAGIGDWNDAPVCIQAAAFECRLCSGPAALTAFGDLVRHAQAHAGKLLHDRSAGAVPYIVTLRALAERHPT